MRQATLMTTLCIDTATQRGLVAVAEEGRLLAAVSWQSKGRHAEDLFGHIDTVLAKAERTRDSLMLVGVDLGPGGFTSLRVGLATAKGLGFALGVPIVGVSSLRVLARGFDAPLGTVCIALMCAYRGEVFAAAYRFGAQAPNLALAQAQEPPPVALHVGPPQKVFEALRAELGDQALIWGGDGARAHHEHIAAMFGSHAAFVEETANYPTASALCAEIHERFTQHGADDLDLLEPRYLRAPDARP